MFYNPIVAWVYEQIDKVKVWNKQHTLLYRIWWISILSPAFIGGLLLSANWQWSLFLLGFAFLLILLGIPIQRREQYYINHYKPHFK